MRNRLNKFRDLPIIRTLLSIAHIHSVDDLVVVVHMQLSKIYGWQCHHTLNTYSHVGFPGGKFLTAATTRIAKALAHKQAKHFQRHADGLIMISIDTATNPAHNT